MPIHQFLTTHGTLESDLVISTGRVQVVAIHCSNRNMTQTGIVSVEDNDGTVYMEIAIRPGESHTVSFAEAVDFTNGLVIDDMPTLGSSMHVSVAHSRTL